MNSAHQPVSLAAHGHLSPQFRSDSRPSDFRKSPDRPLSVASVSPMEGLSVTHHPQLTTHSPLTTFRINTYKKPGEGWRYLRKLRASASLCQIHYFQAFAASLPSFCGSRRLFSAT